MTRLGGPRGRRWARARSPGWAVVLLAFVLVGTGLSSLGPIPWLPSAGVRAEAHGGPGGNNSSGPPSLNYTVAFVEQGLPPGSNWSVTLGGTTRAATASSIEFPDVPAGNASYRVVAPAGYDPAPSAGTLKVNATISFAILFRSTAGPGGTWPLPPLELLLLLGLGAGGAALVVGLELRARRPRRPAATRN
jgi:hypothetical protein